LTLPCILVRWVLLFLAMHFTSTPKFYALIVQWLKNKEVEVIVSLNKLDLIWLPNMFAIVTFIKKLLWLSILNLLLVLMIPKIYMVLA